uniref:Uncharacterized protein n=1 Tax=Meloidogyne enterolobii TaxID=390850 RepID=A0A6V7VID0_MELEN|nr:unnamed protein product [Meloidogyne enterolobii]
MLLFFSIFPLFNFVAGDFALCVVSFPVSTSIISSSSSIFGSLTNSIFEIFSFFNPLIFYLILNIIFNE